MRRHATDVQALTDGRGADHAFEATGVAALAFLPLRLCDRAAHGELKLRSMVTHTYALADLGSALADMLAGRSAKGVILFEPQR